MTVIPITANLMVVPLAYTQLISGAWWVSFPTPSGIVARLLVSYPSKASAEHAIRIYGFRLVQPPIQPVEH